MSIAKTLTAFLFSLNSFAAAPQPFRVVIDPGHGGNDQGTTYDLGKLKLTEKDITLAIAQDLITLLKKSGVETYLTRYEDKDLDLGARTQFANRIGAQVFLSLHMNSTPNQKDTGAQGIETYILNNTSDASSKRLAHLENSVLGGKDSKTPNNDVALILKDLRIDGNLPESKRLACLIQFSLVQETSVRKGHHRNRGVKQALFHVLLGADMPSVLVEMGFLTSAHDRTLVQSKEGRAKIASAIASAIQRFQKRSPKDKNELNRCQVREQFGG
jgi:N-acetylmuramoyl-L-alanine amidase